MKWYRLYKEKTEEGDAVNESSRFGFNVGDKVELTKDKVNSISGDVF